MACQTCECYRWEAGRLFGRSIDRGGCHLPGKIADHVLFFIFFLGSGLIVDQLLWICEGEELIVNACVGRG